MFSGVTLLMEKFKETCGKREREREKNLNLREVTKWPLGHADRQVAFNAGDSYYRCIQLLLLRLLRLHLLRSSTPIFHFPQFLFLRSIQALFHCNGKLVFSFLVLCSFLLRLSNKSNPIRPAVLCPVAVKTNRQY